MRWGDLGWIGALHTTSPSSTGAPSRLTWLILTLLSHHSLCRAPSNRVKGTPFRPVKAVAVDLFPQTPHCEMLILFERVEYPNGTGALEPQDPPAQPPPGSPDDTLQETGASTSS